MLLAASGAEALALLDREGADIVLLDVIIPGESGIEVCRRLRSRSARMPVILVTSLSDEATLREGFEAGATDYITKPFRRAEVRSRVAGALGTVDYERRLERLNADLLSDLEAASIVQRYLVHRPIDYDPPLLVSSHYEPSSKLGGDLFEAVRIGPSRWGFYMCDISGHGTRAALLMAAMKTALRTLFEADSEEFDPATAAQRLNAIVLRDFMDGQFMTALLGTLNTQTQEVTCYSAGHPPPLVVDRTTGDVVTYDAKAGVPLGWRAHLSDAAADQFSFTLPAESVLVLYTDGVFECRNGSGEQLGLAGMRTLLSRMACSEHPMAFPHAFRDALDAGGYDTSADDFTISSIAITRRPEFTFAAMASAGAVSLVSEQIQNAVYRETSDDVLANKAALVYSEIANNAARHGGGEVMSASMVAELSIADRVTLRLFDCGKAFSAAEREARTYEEPDMRKESGYGLHIIRSLTETYSTRRVALLNETVAQLATGTSPGH